MRFSVLTLSGTFRETQRQVGSLYTAASEQEFRYDEFLRTVEELVKRRRVTDILVDCRSDFRVPFLAYAESVARALRRLEDAGKTLHFCAPEYSETTLMLAASCSKRYIHPLGQLRLLGLSASFLFFKRALDRHRIEARVFRRGTYKSGADPFRVTGLDTANEEQYRRYLEVCDEVLCRAIRDGFGREQADIDALRQGRVLSSSEAVDEGWFTEARSARELRNTWRDNKHREHRQKPSKHGDPVFGKGRKKLAVLVFEGTVGDEHSRADPLMGQSVGGESFARQAEKLRTDKHVAGVVLRVQSPGGTAVGSETAQRAVARLAEKKPVVTSLGGVAASGGYWIATAGQRIFAERATLTGSIGALALLFQARDFLKNRGITADTVQSGPYADFPSPYRKLAEAEVQMLNHQLDDVYRSFLERVSASRGMELEQVDALGQGRVWAGDDAVRNGLADELGGLHEALEYLARHLGLKRYGVFFRPRIKPSRLEKLIARQRKRSDEELAGLGSVTGAGPAHSGFSGLANPGALYGSIRGVHGRALTLAPELLTLHHAHG